ncbi:response regulator [Massilia sp. DWR3-1-1]|uniref:response regulator n=1 Tax=Massilia sp. DWR3-1-1 TaxID=2804559 RepID=UPI003CF071EE
MAHILVVEDDTQFLQMLVKMLQADGHRVATAADGALALEQVEQLQPELIITDILMPNLDGVETILALSQRGHATPVIAMSGGRRSISAEFNLASASLMGVEAVLAKPFTRQALREAIGQALA